MTFSDQAKSELDRLEKRKTELSAELTEIEKELKALKAYLGAKEGTVRRTGVRNEVLQLITTSPLTRAELLDKLNAKDDVKKTRSVDNALTALTKKNQIKKTDGKYSLG